MCVMSDLRLSNNQYDVRFSSKYFLINTYLPSTFCIYYVYAMSIIYLRSLPTVYMLFLLSIYVVYLLCIRYVYCLSTFSIYCVYAMSTVYLRSLPTVYMLCLILSIFFRSSYQFWIFFSSTFFSFSELVYLISW